MNDVEIVRFLSQIKGAIGDSINRDEAGRENWVGLFGGRVVGQRAAQISVSFEYNIASRATNTTTTGTGSVTHDSSASQAVVSTGSGIGTARLETVDSLRYRSSHDLYTYMTVVFTESEPHSHQRVGFFDTNDGYFFGFEGTTFGATRRQSGDDEFSKPNQDDLSGTGSSVINIDFSKNNLYRVNYGWLGIAPAVFEVWGGLSNGWVPFHVFDKTNQITTSEISVPNLPVASKVGKTSGTKTISLRHGCFGGGTIALPNTDPAARPFSETNSVTIDADTKTNVLTLKNKSQYQSKTNRIRAFLRMMTMSTEGNKPVQFDIILNGTLGSSSFSDVDSNNSVMQIDTTKTAVSGGDSLHPTQLQKTASTLHHLPGALSAAAVTWNPGEQITLTAESTQSSDIIGALRWVELF